MRVATRRYPNNLRSLDGNMTPPIIAYYTLTGNTRRFIERLDLPAIKVTPDMALTAPFILVTPTYNFGQVPADVAIFLSRNESRLVGVVGAGDRVWGANFAQAGRTISEQYGVTLIGEFEKAGTDEDVRIIRERVVKFETAGN